jgi:ribosomal protein S18 acetylase RimI-like enzyme
MILPLSEQHVEQVARLHCAEVNGLLQRLGTAAARAYYRGAVRSGLALAFVELEEGEVAGFVLGSVHPDQLRRGVIRANLAGTTWGIVLGILKRPASLRWLLRSVAGPDEGSYAATAPELTYLATADDHRGRGIGRRLVDAFNEGLRTRGIPACELSVDEANAPAIGFYERLGFRLIGRYREFGTLHRRYRLELSPVAAGGQGGSA